MDKGGGRAPVFDVEDRGYINRFILVVVEEGMRPIRTWILGLLVIGLFSMMLGWGIPDIKKEKVEDYSRQRCTRY